MKIDIRLFAGLIDLIGVPIMTLTIDQQTVTVEELKQLIAQKYPDSKNLLEHCFFAKNQAYADPQESITESDEVALIPPVSGGEDWPDPREGSRKEEGTQNFAITYETIQIEEITQKVLHPHHGAAIIFIGTTREFTAGQRTVLLEYEAYIPMALKTLQQIGDEIAVAWPGTLCAITHRLGKVSIGETSVAIAVSSPHREQSYEASRYAIERLKQIVPIWKKEIWEDGSEWKGHQQGPWNPTQPLEA